MPPAKPPAVSPRQCAESRLAERRRAPTLPADTPLVGVAIAVAAGAAASPMASWAGVGFAQATFVGAVLLGLWAVLWRRGRVGSAVVLLAMTLAALAAGWADASWRLFTERDVGRYARRDAGPVCLDVVVAEAPSVYPARPPSPFQTIPSTERTVFEARVLSLRDATDWVRAEGRCEITVAGPIEGLTPGDRLRVFGQLRRPRPALNPGERDAAARDRAQRRLAVVWSEAPECVRRLPAGEAGWSLSRWAARWRVAARDSIERRFSASSAPLLKAMLLGDVSGLADETLEAFRWTGMMHLLVVSGMHVGLVAAGLPLLATLGLAPRRLAWGGALLLVVFYVAIVGARPPAVRAGVVTAACAIAVLSGRRAFSANSLAGAAIAAFAVSPGAWLAPGTRLSFLAAATLLGIACAAKRQRAKVSPPLERLIRSVRSPVERRVRWVGAWAGWSLAATVAVQLVTGPLVASEFHIVSPGAALLALPVALPLTLTMGAGVFTLLFDAIAQLLNPAGFLAAGVATCGSLVTDCLRTLIEFAASLPGSGFWTAGPSSWWVALWVLWCGVALAASTCWPRARGAVGRVGLAVLAAAFVQPLWRAAFPVGAVRCTFIAVGHGSSTLIETPGGGTILVDAGALGVPERVADTIARALWARGVQRIDALLLTHPDADHYNAAPGLLERFPIDVVRTTTLMFPSWDDPSDHSGPAELRRLLAAAGVPVRTTKLGERFGVGETEFAVLHPDDIGVIGSDNANSLVLAVEHAGKRALLPGDLEAPGLEALMAQEAYDCDVLLAPHHGSARSDPAGFAAWSRPEEVILSSGETRGEARSSYTAGGARVWSTHERGQITATLAKGGVQMQSFLP